VQQFTETVETAPEVVRRNGVDRNVSARVHGASNDEKQVFGAFVVGRRENVGAEQLIPKAVASLQIVGVVP